MLKFCATLKKQSKDPRIHETNSESYLSPTYQLQTKMLMCIQLHTCTVLPSCRLKNSQANGSAKTSTPAKTKQLLSISRKAREKLYEEYLKNFSDYFNETSKYIFLHFLLLYLPMLKHVFQMYTFLLHYSSDCKHI